MNPIPGCWTVSFISWVLSGPWAPLSWQRVVVLPELALQRASRLLPAQRKGKIWQKLGTAFLKQLFCLFFLFPTKISHLQDANNIVLELDSYSGQNPKSTLSGWINKINILESDIITLIKIVTHCNDSLFVGKVSSNRLLEVILRPQHPLQIG